MSRTAKEVDLEEIIEKQQESIQQITKERDALKQKVGCQMVEGLD